MVACARTAAIVLALTMLMTRSVVGQTFQVSPDEMLSQIASEGPRAVLVRLFEHNEEGFEFVCDRIESGDTSWLRVAERLRGASDAAATLALNYSVARALPARPVNVLRLVGHGFSVDEICTTPFIEPEAGVAEDYQRRAIAALRGIHANDLERPRVACLKRIEEPLPKGQP